MNNLPEEEIAKSEDELKLAQQKKLEQLDAACKKVNKKIDELNKHAKTIEMEAPDKAKLIKDLARTLKGKTMLFKTTVTNPLSEHAKKAYDSFEKDFTKTIIANTAKLGEHRNRIRIILANIIFALTGIGAVFIAIKLIASKAQTGKFELFAPKTESIKRIEDIKAATSDIAMAARGG